MHAEIRYPVFVLLLLLMAGCSAMRKGRTADVSVPSADASYSLILKNVAEDNITDSGFEIRKGSIELEGTELEGKFGLHARLNSKGDFYGSVRGPLGIELVRILMVDNDIAAIDRFNRKVYVGKKDQVLKRNGLPEDFMQIIFGDIPAGQDVTYIGSQNNEITVNSGDDEFRRIISVCIDEMKVCRQEIEAAESGRMIYMSFSNFREKEGRKYASEISVEEKKKMFHVKLFIDELIYGYDSDIEFNLPSYTRESL